MQSVQAAANARVAKIDSSLVSLHKKIQALQASAAGASANSPTAVEIAGLSQAYDTLTLQAETILVSGPYATVQTAADLPAKALGLSKTTTIALAVLVGLLVGIGVALVLAQLDTRLRSTADLDAVIDLPLLAELPLQRRGESGGGASLAFRDQPSSVISQSFRELRTSLDAAEEGHPRRCILITSPVPGDGKTFVAANLAAAEASTGRRVALVSTDPNDRSLEVMLGLSEKAAVGLSYLNCLRRDDFQRLHRQLRHGDGHPVGGAIGPRDTSPAAPEAVHEIAGQVGDADVQAEVSKNLVVTSIPGLSLLPAGDRSPDFDELFSGSGMGLLIKELSRSFDLVLFDSSAVLASANAASLSRVVDGVVLVVAAGESRPLVEQSLQRLEFMHAPLLGVVLNRVRSLKSAAYSEPPRNSVRLGVAAHRTRAKLS